MDVATAAAADDQDVPAGPDQLVADALGPELEVLPVLVVLARLDERDVGDVLVVGDRRVERRRAEGRRLRRQAGEPAERRPALGDLVALRQVVDRPARRDEREGRRRDGTDREPDPDPPPCPLRPREKRHRERRERTRGGDQRRRVGQPEERDDDDRAGRRAEQVEGVEPADRADVVLHGDRDHDPRGEERQRGDQRDQAQREDRRHVDPLVVDRAVVFDPHEDRRDDEQQRGEYRGPTRQAGADAAALEPVRPDVDEDRSGADPEQRQRDRQKGEVVEDDGREQTRQQDLQRERARRDDPDREGDAQRQAGFHGSRNPRASFL